MRVYFTGSFVIVLISIKGEKFMMLSSGSSLGRVNCRTNFFRRVFAIVVVLFVFVTWPSTGYSDFKLGTRDGNTLVWEQFTLEDGNYCTWKKDGKFCLPQSEVISMKEVSGEAPSSSSSQRHYSSTDRNNNSGQNDRGSSVGTMTRGYDSVSGDGRTYYGRGGYSNGDSTSTTYSKEISDADIRLIEAEASVKRQEAENRRLEAEQRVQATRAQEEVRQSRLKHEREMQKQIDDANRNAYRGGRWY
jgi:hypothetical protein